jgi:hypothetical protein
MSCLGVHFAITPEEAAKLEKLDNDDERIDFIGEEIEQSWVEEFVVESDKAWDGIHRCLGEFPPDTPWFYPVNPESGAHARVEDYGSEPLRLAVLGGKKIMDDESQYFIRLVRPEQVADIAAAMKALDREQMHERYFRHCKGAWPEYGEEDFGYIWDYFKEIRDFYGRMVGNGRYVVSTADQ